MQTGKAFVIRQIPPFDGLHSAEIGFLGSILHEDSIPAGTFLFREGDPGDRFYLIVDDEVEVVKAFGTPDERLRAVRQARDFFGEMSLFQPDGRRTASVRARTRLRLLEMARADFESLHEKEKGENQE